MGKKRGKDKSLREDEDVEFTGPSCRHIRKGTDQTLIKKLSAVSDWTRCQECKHEDNKENISTTKSEESEEETVPLWMCLKCGHRGCGRDSENQHAIKHYETPRSDPHCLVVGLDNWSVWCYICDDEVQYSGVKEDVDLMEIKPETEAVNTEESEDNENKDGSSRRKKNIKKENTVKPQNHNAPEESCSVPVKGLSNLGNTCFFNAVLQNLSQTQLLRQILNKPLTHSRRPHPDFRLLLIKGVVTPRELFTQVCKKAARFKGFQQQDSQELLRYLLDGMRAEELKRVSMGITESLKQSSKVTDEEKIKAAVKEYEKNGVPKNFVDQLFGGEMTSTIMCQECKTVSCLCVCDNLLQAYRKKNPKKVFPRTSESSQDERNGSDLISRNDDSTTGASSKYQQKKAKKQAKKQAKNVEQENEEDKDSPTDDGSLAESSVSNRFIVLSEEQHLHDSASCNKTSNTDLEGELDTQLANQLEQVTLNDAFIEDLDSMDPAVESEDEVEYTIINQDPEFAFNTLSTRTSPEKQECSVQSCLFQFTEVETLTQNNSLLCVACTKRHKKGEKTGGSKKNIYTDALKQMLISSPPSVLTLHMKRFQQNGYSICKVNRHVQFPLILDLAPYCSAKCKNIYEGDTQILYSLYGVVEHSGTMRSGHYTAYVKARPDSLKSSSNGDTDLPRGSWFHISDTSVQPVSESKVQSCQAYLLFYERIL
uniref:Ubiquitin carboxyl-terminal hydrolase n=1 Tax=Xiphophorus couchianus TaxID=32473 RepID=A0A3B5L9I4_9TELE